MRMRTLTAAAVAASGLLLAGCGSLGSTVTTTANNGATGAAAKAAKPAAVGDSITVKGFDSEKVTVTLVKVFPNAHGSDEFNAPDAGKEFYAVQLRIVNDATAPWSDSPDNCVELKDASGQQFQMDVDTVTAGQSFAGSINLAKGDSVLGVEVFQIPKGDKVKSLQFTTDSGMGPGTAQWSL
jgi:uncharacterized protein DUF4352